MRLQVQLLALLLLGGISVQQSAALEVNYWPLFTGERDAEGNMLSVQMGGPIAFERIAPAFPHGGDQIISGIRPFVVKFDEVDQERGSLHILYPIFNVRQRPYGVSWDLFTLLRFESMRTPAGTDDDDEVTRSFRLFPILFWQKAPDPDRSYFGVFPIAGSAQNFFMYDEASWFLFPLTARLERGQVTTYAMPWPFIRIVRGPDTRGFHLWPLYGNVERENASRHRYWIWPLGYHVERELWKEEPFEAFGFLPFYARSSSDRAVSETFVWPFFGYTHSDQPEYREIRYFWPLLVQRRGESYINRWMPIYSRSIRGERDTRWVLWPLHRYSTWEEGGLRNDRTQFLYFLYWSNIQSSVANPELDPAVKQHVWPFYSYWDDGAGRRQFQALSPFEVFFPFNEVVREKYSPLFAFYRLDVREDVRTRQSFLFNLVTTRREVEEETFHLNVGPLLHYASGPEHREWSLLKGLLSYTRSEEERSLDVLWLNRLAEDGAAARRPTVRRLGSAMPRVRRAPQLLSDEPETDFPDNEHE